MNLAVMGLQWGDEGKGKAIDYLAGDFDVVVRFQGGHNAGHTVCFQGQRVVLHLLPSGIFWPKIVSVIGNGVVVNPLELVKEIKEVKQLGLLLKNLVISAHAPLILPYHQLLDVIFEDSRYIKIGTTQRGIGPAYEDLSGRRAVFVGDLFDKDRFYRKVEPLNNYYNKLIQAFGGQDIDIDSYIDNYLEAGRVLKPFAGHTAYLLNDFLAAHKSILFESAQGILLDINLGTYPFVTSSNPSVGGIFPGTGLSHKALDRVVGITKAYTTRVGEGPFPSELFDWIAGFLRQKGNEYGATTGRPRRVGWLDLVALKYAIMVNGVDDIFLTKLDVLDDLDEIQVVTAYEIDGQKTTVFDPVIDFLDRVKPVLTRFPGWKQEIKHCRDYASLPGETRAYISFIEEYTGIKVKYISVGTDRDQTIQKI